MGDEKTIYTMTEDELKSLKEAVKIKRFYIEGDKKLGTPQEMLKRAWQKIADRLGFILETVEPIDENDPSDGYFKGGRFYAIKRKPL